MEIGDKLFIELAWHIAPLPRLTASSKNKKPQPTPFALLSAPFTSHGGTATRARARRNIRVARPADY